MKNYLMLLFCLFSGLSAFSQVTPATSSQNSKELPKLKKHDLIEMKRFSQFAQILPKDFKTITGEVVFKIDGGKLVSHNFKNDTIPSNIHEEFKKLDVGSTLYVDAFVNGLKPVEQGKSNGQSFGFVIVE